MTFPYRILLTLVCLLLLSFGKVNGQEESSWSTPVPLYPPKALEEKEEGRGLFRVATDAKGTIQTVSIAQTTSSKTLDEATLQTARARWQGPPKSAIIVPIEYRLPKGDHAKPLVVTFPSDWKIWHVTRIAYPQRARANHITGSGVVQVSTNDKGRVVRARMMVSTGSKLLDGCVVDTALASWSGPRNGETKVPISFKLRR